MAVSQLALTGACFDVSVFSRQLAPGSPAVFVGNLQASSLLSLPRISILPWLLLFQLFQFLFHHHLLLLLG
jgi:hypothetical protein